MSIDPMSTAKINSLTEGGGKFFEWDKEGRNNQSNVNSTITPTNNITTTVNTQPSNLFHQNKMKSTNHFRKFNFGIGSEPQLESKQSIKNKNIFQCNQPKSHLLFPRTNCKTNRCQI